MSEYKVKTSHLFSNDMDRLHVYLIRSEVNEKVIQDIDEEIYQNLKRLRTSPRVGTSLNTKTSIPNDYRYFTSGKYLIFYKVFEQEKLVQVYHIYHRKENYLTKLGM